MWIRWCGPLPERAIPTQNALLVTRSLDPKGTGQTKWGVRWKPALYALAIFVADRMPAAEER
ncbi:putative transposase [Gordonia terrae NBRC 100016]|uniref:Transposase n=1 Tax=Gordonia terrae NBRC 100016 TaxID=1089454 RepID=A0ABQ0HKG2_9ACTN|nr:putative transposase [Gordonia terrae NBRC 100016]